MEQYISYINRQENSRELHEKLLTLPAGRSRPARVWLRVASLAACCLLAVWRFALSGQGPGLSHGADANDPGQGLPQLDISVVYRELEEGEREDLCLAWEPGSFVRDMTPEQITGLFGQDTLPESLHWEEYKLQGRLYYDGQGRLNWLGLFGTHPNGANFELNLRPNELPPECCIKADRVWTYSQVFGTRVAGWSDSWDRDGDGAKDNICGAEFMAGTVGVRFESTNSPFTGADQEQAACTFNALLVQQALSEEEGLSLEALLTAEQIPAWREENFSSLEQARQAEEFAPYLPVEGPVGWESFRGSLSYQEGVQNELSVYWSRGYDDVVVSVLLPEGEADWGAVTDVSDPAAYDVRLYPIPWAESVPEEYFESFHAPVFRAEDMSLPVVEARTSGTGDTGSPQASFSVLYSDGTLARYTCKGLSAEQVWKLVEPTLD